MERGNIDTSPEEQLSKLFGSYKAEWLKEKIYDLFKEPSYFPELRTPRPCVLEGGRGTGKTTVLRGLSYEGQYALSGYDRESVAKWDYIGLYYRVNTNRVTAFKGPELIESQWIRIFAHYFNLIICEQVLGFLKWHHNLYPEHPGMNETECNKISSSLHLLKCSDIEELTRQLDLSKTKFEAQINNVGDQQEFKLSMQGAPIDAITAAVLQLPHFKNKQFYILLDEYENLLEYQQQIINTLIKHTTENYTFKIGVRELGWRQRTTLNPNEILISPADYVVINIIKKLGGDKFAKFAETVCNARISKIDIPGCKIIKDIKEALPSLSEDAEASLLGIDEKANQIRNHLSSELTKDEMNILNSLTPLQLYFLNFWAEGQKDDLLSTFRNYTENVSEWEVRFLNYKHSLLYTIRKGKRGIHKYYCGWDVFTQLASDNIRYLLELVEQSYLLQLQDGLRLDKPIDLTIQTKAASNVGRKNLSELEGLSVDGAQITKLLLGLGRVFQVMALEAAGHAPEVNQFYIKQNTDDITSSISISKLITSAVMHLALVRTTGSKPTDKGQTRDYDYMIHPIFCAFFEFSYRRKRKLLLEDTDILGLINNPKQIIKNILLRNNRLTDEENETLAEQLMLFEGYYEGHS